ncbi:MAG: ankyrin repeat domain-containing protein, partial [Anaerolineae bacterium]|nr:ankyrin repeat domain-containing protein [Anaerolineae bacterium]
SIETLRVLLGAGANVNDTLPSGVSALVLAVHSGYTETAKFLLDRGADLHAANAGYTAFHAAVLRADMEMVETLLARGADHNAVITRGSPGRRFSLD